jgi:lipopolysaccharide/colanic/teichoic acid biosynthesis glycosyltransferase
MLVVALAVSLSGPGPVIFRQARVGYRGRPIVIYKFRTMTPHDRAAESAPFSERIQKHKDPGDPRITRVGRLLRRSSLDELPQLWNVVRGDMSLVGPRPEMPWIVAEYAPWQHLRHLVLPGLTGLWQVSGRSDLPMHENTELDLRYVEQVSLRADLSILLRTTRTVFRRHGAY